VASDDLFVYAVLGCFTMFILAHVVRGCLRIWAANAELQQRLDELRKQAGELVTPDTPPVPSTYSEHWTTVEITRDGQTITGEAASIDEAWRQARGRRVSSDNADRAMADLQRTIESMPQLPELPPVPEIPSVDEFLSPGGQAAWQRSMDTYFQQIRRAQERLVPPDEARRNARTLELLRAQQQPDPTPPQPQEDHRRIDL
jgi:hypothetical protein